MVSIFLAVALLSLGTNDAQPFGKTAGTQPGKNVTPFPDKLFGTYVRKEGVPTKAILGPISFDFLPSMNVLRDPETNDVWFTLLQGQMWHVIGNQTQYCFGPASTKTLSEQSPFSVDSITDTSVNFCWRRGLRGMPTQKKGCFGCDCARILLELTDPDTLHFQFWMSPPVLHADVMFIRSGPQTTFQKAILSTMKDPYMQCTLKDHYGPNVPNEPILTTVPPTSSTSPKFTGGCAQSISETLAMNMKSDDIVPQGAGLADSGEGDTCYQLNGVNLQLDNLARWTQPAKVMNVTDVQIRYTTPNRPCAPCDVSYSVSAKTEEDEYIAVGFKGRSWEKDFPYAPEHPLRPCYFGMCVDSFDNFTSDRIALGYTAHGGCVRELVAENIIGTPVDVDYKILKSTSVERVSGRTVLRFTVSQHWQWDDNLTQTDGPWRIMWAVGKVAPVTSNKMLDACTATLGYHNNHRGVAPLHWLQSLGSSSCGSKDIPTMV